MVPVLGILSRNVGTSEHTWVRHSARVGLGLFQRGGKKTQWKWKTDSTFSGAKVSWVHRGMGEGRVRGGGRTGGAKRGKDEDSRILVPFTTKTHSPLSLPCLTCPTFFFQFHVLTCFWTASIVNTYLKSKMFFSLFFLGGDFQFYLWGIW